MQVKVTPLSFNPVTKEFEASSNVSMPDLVEGRLRIRVGFLPMNEQQHEIIAELLRKSDCDIVNGSADPLLRITRDDEVARLAPGQSPKVHAIGSPLFLDIEIGPPHARQAGTQSIKEIGPALLPAGPETADEAPQPSADSASAGLDSPAATQAPAPPAGATPTPPADTSNVVDASTTAYVDEPDHAAAIDPTVDTLDFRDADPSKIASTE